MRDLFNGKRGKPENPIIPTPPAKEVTDTELLVTPEYEPLEHHDTRLVERKTSKPPTTRPRFNKLYDSLRSEDAWEHLSDLFLNGTVTTVAGAAVSVNLSLAQSPHYRLGQWPRGVQLYMYVRSFGIAPQAAPATVGAIEVLLLDSGGVVAPLGDFVSNAGGNTSPRVLMPTPITDTDSQQIGSLQVALNAGATAGTLNWSLGLSLAYLLPSPQGYEPEHEHEGSRYAGHAH